MAKLEDLIKNIPNAQLRDEIAREVAKLKAEKKFGLVFEEHIPEQVQLPDFEAKAGARVMKRGSKNDDICIVTNNFVDKNDRYRHSKWLAMMKRRSLLAMN